MLKTLNFKLLKIFIQFYVTKNNILNIRIKEENMKGSFDDFVTIDGKLDQVFVDLALRYTKIFLRKIGATKVDEADVKFVRQPFLDVLYGFRINGQIVLLDQSFIRQKALKEKYDSTLAHIFNQCNYDQIEQICQTIKNKIVKLYVKPTS